MGLTDDNDPYTGEIYESRDYRDKGRRIRILAIHENQDSARGMVAEPTTYYRAVRIDPVTGEQNGRAVKISDHTLSNKRRYRKVSR